MARNRRFGSIKDELIKKSREAAIAAVQIFNNPSLYFKTELFIVTMMISWTYLMHAYYRDIGIDYRYSEPNGRRRKFSKTKRGAYKYWELERCIDDDNCPLNPGTKNNLRFLIGLRHEIEHQMTTNIDKTVSAKLQACCLNYNTAIKSLFGDDYGVDKYLSISLQFSCITPEQVEDLKSASDLPANISTFIEDFERDMTADELRSEGYAYRVLFVPIAANRKGQADEVIEFVKEGTELAASVNKSYAFIKETEKKKYLPKQIVTLMNKEGFLRFSIVDHTRLWQNMDAKNPIRNFGTIVAGKSWHWYENWVAVVRKHCQEHKNWYE